MANTKSPSTNSNNITSKISRADHSTFPVLLHKMLEDAKSGGFERVVSWLPGGKSFLVHDPEMFVQRIVPSYFSLTKYKSFLRQLTIYGFQRIDRGPHKGGYFHPLFFRGDGCKVTSISRCSPKSTTPRNTNTCNPKAAKHGIDHTGLERRNADQSQEITGSSMQPLKLEPKANAFCHAISETHDMGQNRVVAGNFPVGHSSDIFYDIAGLRDRIDSNIEDIVDEIILTFR